MSDDYTLKLISDVSEETVSLTEAKEQLRIINTNEEDQYITGLISTARKAIEHAIGRLLGTQTWEVALPNFPAGRIEIPRPPLLSVISIKYKLEAGTTSTLADSEASPEVTSTVYDVEVNDEPGFIFLQPSETWPTDALYPGFPVTVRFTAGMAVEADLKHAILLMISHFFELRMPFPVELGLSVAVEIPKSVDWLLFHHRDNF